MQRNRALEITQLPPQLPEVDLELAAAFTQQVYEESGYAGSVSLTPRQHAVWRGIARGMSTRHIALDLGIAFATAERHIFELYRAIVPPSWANPRTYAAMLYNRLLWNRRSGQPSGEIVIHQVRNGNRAFLEIIAT